MLEQDSNPFRKLPHLNPSSAKQLTIHLITSFPYTLCGIRALVIKPKTARVGKHYHLMSYGTCLNFSPPLYNDI